MNAREHRRARRVAPIRAQLRALYESNRASAARFGQWWAVDDYACRIRHLDEHPRGPLTAAMRRDVRYYAGLIRREP